jgi:hypothetical protein
MTCLGALRAFRSTLDPNVHIPRLALAGVSSEADSIKSCVMIN